LPSSFEDEEIEDEQFSVARGPASFNINGKIDDEDTETKSRFIPPK